MNRGPGEVRVLRGWRRWALLPLVLLLRLWCATLRWRVSAASRASLAEADSPRVVLLWHEHLFLAPELYRRFRRHLRPMAALVSASNDGAWISAALEAVGMTPARGSSSRRALSATKELASRIEAGFDVCITPDGPRGPRRACKVGAAFLGRQTGAGYLLVGIRHGRAWTLRSWDRFRIPVPGSTVTVEARVVPGPDGREGWGDEETAAWLSRELDALEDQGPA